MAVYSMTGYGSASHDGAAEGTAGVSVTVELRSVNGRFLDLALRLPDDLRGLEPALRDLVGGRFRRGKIELRVSTPREADSGWPQPTPDQLGRLGQLEGRVQSWLPQAAALSVHEAMQWCRAAAPAARLDEPTLEAARRAAQALSQSRAREGDRLVAVLRERIAHLRGLASQAAPLVPAVVQRQQQRFLDRWKEALAAADASHAVSPEALQERALNEAAAFAVRIDVAEELARLTAHLDEIEQTLRRGGELGKRLDFLIQELHREANTLGSKSAALELTNVAVEMKVAIEQMREQVQNLE
jgi:uncharacterized protein YicC (UPF0701 family)